MIVANRRALAASWSRPPRRRCIGLALPAAAYAAYGAVRARTPISAAARSSIALWSLPGSADAVAAIVAFRPLAVRRGYWPGLLPRSALGCWLAPYTLIYGAGLLAVAAPASVRASPRAALGLAISAPVALVARVPGLGRPRASVRGRDTGRGVAGGAVPWRARLARAPLAGGRRSREDRRP